jgi:hypothetical protein
MDRYADHIMITGGVGAFGDFPKLLMDRVGKTGALNIRLLGLWYRNEGWCLVVSIPALLVSAPNDWGVQILKNISHCGFFLFPFFLVITAVVLHYNTGHPIHVDCAASTLAPLRPDRSKWASRLSFTVSCTFQDLCTVAIITRFFFKKNTNSLDGPVTACSTKPLKEGIEIIMEGGGTKLNNQLYIWKINTLKLRGQCTTEWFQTYTYQTEGISHGKPPPMPPIGGGGARPMSSFSMAVTMNAFMGPSQNANPSDGELLKHYLSTQDLTTVTKNCVVFSFNCPALTCPH